MTAIPLHDPDEEDCLDDDSPREFFNETTELLVTDRCGNARSFLPLLRSPRDRWRWALSVGILGVSGMALLLTVAGVFLLTAPRAWAKPRREQPNLLDDAAYLLGSQAESQSVIKAPDNPYASQAGSLAMGEDPEDALAKDNAPKNGPAKVGLEVRTSPCESAESIIDSHTSIAASSEWSANDAAWRSRMDQIGWAAHVTDNDQWLEWDFRRRWSFRDSSMHHVPHPVLATIMQVQTAGRKVATPQQYISKYTLEYTRDGASWTTYPLELTGNDDATTVVKNNLDPWITAQVLRLHVKDWHRDGGPPAGRVNLVGCLHVDVNATVSTTATTTTTVTTTRFTGCNASEYNSTMINRTDDSDRSLFCWMVMMTHGYEPELVKKQYEHSWGIFACEEHMILSDGYDIAEISHSERSLPIGRMQTGKGHWGSWVNAGVFLKAWKVVLEDCRYLLHDWIIKADPDTVFFPERLKAHLQYYQIPWSGDESWWVSNYQYYLVGAIEIMSRAALEIYGDRHKECLWQVDHGGPCPGAEDFYIARCLNDKLGIERRVDKNCLQHQKGNQCWDRSKAAYHPFKSLWLYETCVKEATG